MRKLTYAIAALATLAVGVFRPSPMRPDWRLRRRRP